MEGLREIGLSENEILVFVELNHTGPQSVWAIATKVGLKRTTTYDIIKSLAQKNLVSTKNEGKKTLYFAVDPKVLMEQFELKKELLSQSIQTLEKSRSKSSTPMRITKYTGSQGIRVAMNMLLHSPQTIYGWGNNTLCERILDFYPENFAQKRIDKGIKLQAIIEPGRGFFANNEKFAELTHIRHNTLMESQKIVYFLQDGKVIVIKMHLRDCEVIVTEDADYFISQMQLFAYLWASGQSF